MTAVETREGVDPQLLHAWLAARSIARGLPAPVSDRGGFRVDTGSEAEIRRWVFPGMRAGLVELARTIVVSRHLLKLCGEATELRAAIPAHWEIAAPSWFMRAGTPPPSRPLAVGYRIETVRTDAVVEVRILAANGDLAASGHAAETAEAFVYDRIVTDPAHRRRGLGRAVMAALRSAKRRPATTELLVATESGRALYATLGWEIVSPYATASIAPGRSREDQYPLIE